MISELKNTKIYIADDDEDDRMLIRVAIENVVQNVTIIEAADGNQLLSFLSSEETGRQLVIMDMNMPGMSGLETLAVIKSNDGTRHIPVIMVSTASSPVLVKRAYDQGINAYMTKPLFANEYQKIANVINHCYLNDHSSAIVKSAGKYMREKNILVIEDNFDHRTLINMALKDNLPLAQITSVKDETDTIDFFTSVWNNLAPLPHLILLDLYLPNRQNGLHLLELIRNFLKSQNLLNVPIIVLSNSDHPDDITECYRHNANAYMIKSQDLQTWRSYFSNLCHLWLETINLPSVL
ncbi:response regulator [Dyadobacter flavalbus]|uniref:Response regulator n=1 Tax=Dyadobacter flavalbus TaxID=2579942 RepID=A0A5M8QQW2_9BACT|nr:response regulator [Dyadobacter flavalbus]KAA6437026.1 response regulator [Dyadobacter flavalbus]